MTNEARDAVDQTAEFAAPERAVPEREDAEAVGVAARPRRSFVRATVAPIAVALAMSAGAGALVLVPQGSDTIDAVAAPQERVTSISRSAQRAVLPSTSATPTIPGEIKRYFRDKTSGIKVPRWLQELHQAARRTLLERCPALLAGGGAAGRA